MNPIETVFECRCCGVYCHGWTNGFFSEPGWKRIQFIDGPNAICPNCCNNPQALDFLKEDGFDRAVVVDSVRQNYSQHDSESLQDS